MSVSPMKLHVAMAPGSREVRAVNVFNNGDAPVRVLTHVGQWDTTPVGEMDLSPECPVERSADAFVAPELAEFTVAPHDDAIVRVVAALPDSAVGSYWAMVFFECDGADQLEGVGVSTNVCFGTTVYLTAIGTEVREDALTAMAVGPAAEPGGWSLDFTVENRGNVYHYPAGWVQVFGAGDEALLETRLPVRVLLPMHDVTYRQPWFPPAPGEYRLLVTLDLGLDALVQGEKTFTVPPAALPQAARVQP